MAYEAGYSFEDFKNKRSEYPFPLIWFGVFEKPKLLDHHSSVSESISKKKYRIRNMRPSLSFHEYEKVLKRIKQYICTGDTYQVNFTFKYLFQFSGNPFSLYEDLKQKQRVSYASFIQGDKFTSMSLSPELFFKKQGSKIYVRPMKGTIERGLDLKDDQEHVRELKKDPKTLAENLMIVDLLRNDLVEDENPLGGCCLRRLSNDLQID